MSEVTSFTIEIPAKLGARLVALAGEAGRSSADLAAEAIATYIEKNAAFIADVRKALEEGKSGDPGIPHEDIERWIDSWDTDHELPPPEPRF